MANPEHVEIVKAGAEAIREWREKSPGARLNLRGTNLSRARLSGADLRGVKFRRANLSLADLSGVDLSGADLIKVNLSGADLTGALFCQASTGSTIFGAVDLCTAKQLQSVRHLGPSRIDLDTLRKAKGTLPEAFLRGCGLADWEIAFARTFAEGLTHEQITTIGYDIINAHNDKPLQYYSAFISYTHADKAFARRLHDALQEKGIRCWLDEHQLLPGDDIYEGVDRGIRLWDKVLLCSSKDSLTSWWVDDEISRTFAKEQEIMKERGTKVLSLIPLNLDGFLFQWQSAKAQQVKTRLAADFTGWENDNGKFDAELEKLIRAMRADGGGREPPPTPRL